MSLRSKLRAALLRCVAIGFGLGFGLLAAEIALRVIAPQEKSWLDIYREDPVLPLVSFAPDASTTVVTGESQWRVRTDANGHRIGEAGAGDAALPALAVLGDSFAFGHGVEFEQSFPALVVAGLDRRYRLVNTGVPGFGPVQYRQILESLLQWEQPPAALLLSIYVGNDFFDCVWDKRARVVGGVMVEDSGRLRTWLKFNLHSYRLASRVYQRLRAQSRPGRNPEESMFEAEAWRRGLLESALDIFRSEVARIGELARAAGIPVLAVVIPQETSLLHGPAAQPGGPDFGLPTVYAALALEAAGIPFVDLSEPLRALGAANAYFARDGHLTPEGNRVAADAISRAFRERVAPN